MTGLTNLRPVAPSGPTLPDGVVRSLIADELDRINDVLEELGTRLCCDPEIVRSHLLVLQAIDELCQRNENLARTLRADDMVAQASGITLETLRVRLQSAIARQLGDGDYDATS